MLSTTDRTRLRRAKHKARTDRADLYDVLDHGLLCHLAVVVVGTPLAVPTCHARVGDTLYLHGSTGARSLRQDGEVCDRHRARRPGPVPLGHAPLLQPPFGDGSGYSTIVRGQRRT